MARTSETKLVINEELHQSVLPKYLDVLKRLKAKFEVVQDSEFSNLVNFKTNKTQPIHNWFDYKQGYASLLINKIIEKESPGKNEFVLDPFCGVGTTNVVAQSMGFKSIGFDINPVATLASKVKCANYSEQDIEMIQKEINAFSPTATKIVPQSPLLDKSFDTKTFNQLMKIKGFYEKTSNEKVSDFLKLAYLSIVENCSNRIKDGNGIKIVKNKKSVGDVYVYYKSKVENMIKDIGLSKEHPNSIIINGSMLIDEDFKKIKKKQAGIVIFSPPYANCFDYCEVYKLELWMGDFVQAYSDFWNYRSIAMRSHVNSKFDHNINNPNQSVEIISQLISTFNIWNKNIPDMVKGYFDDMEEMLSRLKAVMTPKSKCYIVVANSGYRGVLVPTDLLISEIASKLGFVVEEVIHARKIRASSQQMKELHGEYENLMRESIIVIRNEI
ncbi:hypothetical protein HOG31_02305 [archaeon]|nr:hypothetical protein [archaeon]MBT3730810.1 hypothetical protein [archaeon]MBT4670124.1 hypothetical protein [archaeon]MBT7052611.1 hypothetical protein [archaeon]MBT7402929.1 hypothetical protein [Candidatus Woesearchaeota archaeon]